MVAEQHGSISGKLTIIVTTDCLCAAAHVLFPPVLQIEAWQHISYLAWVDKLINMPSWKVRR